MNVKRKVLQIGSVSHGTLRNEDIIDSRDVIERIAFLESERDAIKDPAELSEWQEGDDGEELKALIELRDGCECVSDWDFGEVLIRDSFFERYAVQLAEDCGMIPSDLQWPCTCIDWAEAARELQMDYTSVTFAGEDYWVRA